MSLHPAIRVLLLLALASALPRQSLMALAVFGAAVLLLYVMLAPAALQRLRMGLWRMRWLLLAIFVLYGGFTPGEPLFAEAPGISREGVLEGARRALVLTDLLVMVYLLLALTPTTALISAIRLLLSPLRPLGVNPDRIGLRIALALEGVGAMQDRWRDRGQAEAQTGSPWARAAAWIHEIEQRAELSSLPLELPPLCMPRWWEWLLPLMVLFLLHGWPL